MGTVRSAMDVAPASATLDGPAVAQTLDGLRIPTPWWHIEGRSACSSSAVNPVRGARPVAGTLGSAPVHRTSVVLAIRTGPVRPWRVLASGERRRAVTL